MAHVGHNLRLLVSSLVMYVVFDLVLVIYTYYKRPGMWHKAEQIINSEAGAYGLGLALLAGIGTFQAL